MTISGGIALHPQTGQPIIQLSDDDMKAVKGLESAGFGLPEIPGTGHTARLREITGALTRSQKYEQWRKAFVDASESRDPRIQSAFKDANLGMRQKFLTAGDVHTDASMSNMSVMYGNDDFIGTELMPIVPVNKQSNVYQVYTKRDRFAAPDAQIGDYGEAKEINQTRSTSSYACENFALKDAIAVTTLANQDEPLNEMVDLQSGILDLLFLAEEIRIAAVVGAAASYGTNTAAKAAAARWDVPGGDPIADMQAASAAMWKGRGSSAKYMFSDLDIYHVLSRHQDILGLFQYNGSSPGLATPDMIAKYIGAERYLIGEGRYDTANLGTTASYSRIWPAVWGMIRVARTPSLRNASFGYTLRWSLSGMANVSANQGMVTKQWYDPTKGLGGSYYAEVGHSEDHKVVAGDTGYLYTTIIN